jgi:Zn-dependent protease
MDNGIDVSLPASHTAGAPALPGAPSYPSHASPVVPQPAAQPPGVDGERADPFSARRASPAQSLRKRIGGILAAIGAVLLKFFAAIKGVLLLLPKFLATAATALVSIVAYSLFFGWTFAVGFVALIFVHEMGHVIQLRREGIKASAPMFIPLLGAVITAKSLGENALAEARVGLAGPILGTVGAGVCLAIGEASNSDFFRALAYIGFFLNLFNLLPVVPLDGGRAMAAMAPWMWFLGFGALVAMLFIFPNLILLLIVAFAGMETWRRWQQRKTRSLEQAAYYRVAPRHRLIVGTVYIGLIAILVLGMDASHILNSGGHHFGSL